MSSRNTPDSSPSTCPPMYVSDSSKCPLENLNPSRFCLSGHMMSPSNALTMSSSSQSVPEPLRRTSAGGRGRMVQSEKINEWTYLVYK